MLFLQDKSRRALLLLLVFLAVCALGGGASRADASSQMIVRVAGILLMTLVLLMHSGFEARRIRAPLIFIGACAAVIVAQMIPLPPAIWTALPGRDFYVEIGNLTGTAGAWRPISLTPDTTINSLLSLIPPTAVVIAMAALSAQQRATLLPTLIIIAMTSAIFGVVQITAGGSGLSLYRISSEGSPIGLFANRNHQAALLAIILPALGAWASMTDDRRVLVRRITAVGLAILILPLILVNGSRAGLLLALIGLAGSIPLVLRAPVRFSAPGGGKVGRWAYVAAGVAIIGALAATVINPRALTLTRVAQSADQEENRVVLFKPVVEMAQTFFPFGSGFGSFDTAFRRFETFDLLNRRYFNHAHNDPLELVTDAGLAGAALLLVFLIWWSRQVVRLWIRQSASSRAILLGRLGSVITAMLFVASIVDYPLRTPLMAVIFAIACLWMYLAKTGNEGGRSGNTVMPLP